MKKTKAVGSYFQAIRNKVGRDECGDAVLQREFPAVVKGREHCSDGEHEKAFLDEKRWGAQSKQALPFCQKSDPVPVTADGRVQENSTSLNWRSCTVCNLGGEAGRGEGTSRRVMQKD